MRLLSIETSCDETAVSILEATGGTDNARFSVLGNALLSQIDIHKEYGGVYPMLAKREHAKNLVPLLEKALIEANLPGREAPIIDAIDDEIERILEREPDLTELFFTFLRRSPIPEIDAIAVTAGPGLVPALWVGVNLARALSLAWNKPLIAVNHMEGHMLSALACEEDGALVIDDVQFPVVGLLISGGHTEIVSMDAWHSYQLMGATKDDAVGEAYDKVARMLDLPYPGGPEISKLAEATREEAFDAGEKLPRPMINDGTCDFSFSGLKTAVLYRIKKLPDLTDAEKTRIARGFEDAVADVLWTKTSRAIEETGANTLVIGGGVSGNTNLRRVFAEKIAAEHSGTTLRIPPRALTTDNAIMIGIAAYYRALAHEYSNRETLNADGNLALAKRDKS